MLKILIGLWGKKRRQQHKRNERGLYLPLFSNFPKALEL